MLFIHLLKIILITQKKKLCTFFLNYRKKQFSASRDLAISSKDLHHPKTDCHLQLSLESKQLYTNISDFYFLPRQFLHSPLKL